MKSFFKNLLQFLVFSLVGYGVILLVFNYCYEREIDEANTVRKDAHVLVFGNSHIAYGIDDKTYPIFESRGTEMEPYYLSYHKLKNILEHPDFSASQVDVICVRYDFIALSARNAKALNGSMASHFIDRYELIFRKLSNCPQYYNMPCTLSSSRLWINSHIPKISTLMALRRSRKVFNFKDYVGGFLETNRVLNEKKDPESAVRAHLGNGEEDYDSIFPSPNIEEQNLRLMLDVARKHHVQVVLLSPPHHQQYLNLIYPKLIDRQRNVMNQLVEEYQVIHLDYSHLELPDDHYSDFNHLNAKGAKVFTGILLQKLKELHLIKGE